MARVLAEAIAVINASEPLAATIFSASQNTLIRMLVRLLGYFGYVNTVINIYLNCDNLYPKTKKPVFLRGLSP